MVTVPAETLYGAIGYATSISFEFLPFSSSSRDMLRDMCRFMGLQIVRPIYDKSFSRKQAPEGQRFPRG